MHVVIILLILFILLYCFAIFPEMSRQKRMKAFHGINVRPQRASQ